MGVLQDLEGVQDWSCK